MITKEQIGIWMDHSVAHIMEMNSVDIVTNIVKSELTPEERDNDFHDKNEYPIHNSEQSLLANCYKKITAAIMAYEGIALFGPTDAKTELLNLLAADHHFENKKIEALMADNDRESTTRFC